MGSIGAMSQGSGDRYFQENERVNKCMNERGKTIERINEESNKRKNA
jgi:IMP dehydrogenase/GMP reductase